MAKKIVVVDYDKAISDFLHDVKAWLDARVPRDSTEVAEIADTKKMWATFMSNPREYVKTANLENYVLKNMKGFSVKHGVSYYDNTMLGALIDILFEIKSYYESGDAEKTMLAEVLKKYRMLRAKNTIERFKISLTNAQKLIAQKQK